MDKWYVEIVRDGTTTRHGPYAVLEEARYVRATEEEKYPSGVWIRIYKQGTW
jgi:hypothetical protein